MDHDFRSEPPSKRLRGARNGWNGQVPKTLGVTNLGMARSSKNSQPARRDTLSNDHLDVPRPAVTTVLSADVKIGGDLDLDETNVIAFFRKENHKVRLSVIVISKVLRSTVAIFNTDAGRNLDRNPSF